MAAESANRLQEPYLVTQDISRSENLKLYTKAIVGISESDRYDLTRSKWNEFYQELEDSVYTFGFKAEVLIVTSRYCGHEPTEIKDIIMSYPSITHVMVSLHYEILWSDNSGEDLRRHPQQVLQQD